MIKQIWISTRFGVISRYPSAADKPFPFISPVVLPSHSAVKRPFEGFFGLRPPGRSPWHCQPPAKRGRYQPKMLQFSRLPEKPG